VVRVSEVTLHTRCRWEREGEGGVRKVTLRTRSPSPLHPYSGGREGHWKGWALKLMSKELKTYTTEYRTKNTETHVHKITNVLYLPVFLYGAWT
jgi:hypothetical protein